MASDDLDEDAAEVINRVSAAMTADELLQLNQRSVDEELPAQQIAADWLADADLG